MRTPTIRYTSIVMMLEDIMQMYRDETMILVHRYLNGRTKRTRHRILEHARRYSLINKVPAQLEHLDRLIHLTDTDCIDSLRMDRNTFGKLCRILHGRGGLQIGKCLGIEEQVAIFLCVLAHHTKNRIVRFSFTRSGSTVPYYVNKVLGVVLSLHDILLSAPIPVPDDSIDHRWKWFRGCLGALDGTHISILVSNSDKLRYRTRKGTIATNVLAACDRDMQFVYILPGWEGSAGDSRVLRDAVSRNNGFRVPQGCYYLGDNAYANSPGFLTPYKGVRYHLKEWGVGDQAPQEPKEIFNMRHSKARNVIERAFAVLKMRWGILRSPSFYPIQTQISKCCNASENLMAFPSACVARGRWCCVVQVNKQLTRVGITSNARKISTTLDHLCGVMSTSEGGMKGLHSMSVKPLHDWARIWLMHPLDQPLPPDVTTVAPSMQKEMCVTSY